MFGTSFSRIPVYQCFPFSPLYLMIYGANTKKFFEALAGFPQTLTLFLRAWRGMVQRKRPGTGGLRPTGTRPNLLAEPTYSVGMSRLTFFEPTRA